MSAKQFATLVTISLSLLSATIPASRAATSTATVAVSAIVAPHCEVGSQFGGASLERHARTLAVACDMSVPYTVTYDDESTSEQHSFTTSSDATTGRIAATITY